MSVNTRIAMTIQTISILWYSKYGIRLSLIGALLMTFNLRLPLNVKRAQLWMTSILLASLENLQCQHSDNLNYNDNRQFRKYHVFL